MIPFKSVLITGGGGFVGSNLALLLREAWPSLRVTVLDSLKRRGSELNLPRLAETGIEFRHGDIRCRDDFDDLPAFDLMIDCSAEPSVQAGLGGSPQAVLDTNLMGTIHCLEAAREQGAAFLFLSTSRVYPIQPLNDLPHEETSTRFSWTDRTDIPGYSERGVSEGFTLKGARSFYGTSKLAGEHLIEEYVYSYGLRALINRCGVIAGPWQMGKVDQGVITLWVARHFFGRPLRYTGFGGTGKQVRDILHVADLFDLIRLQLETPECWDGRVYNVGGGREGSVSLLELTELCVKETGNTVPITSVPETAGVDLRVYLTDTTKVQADFKWKPARNPARIVHDIHAWIDNHQQMVGRLLA